MNLNHFFKEGWRVLGFEDWGLGIGDWVLRIGDWGLVSAEEEKVNRLDLEILLV
jgi:hypothetical protein